MAQNGIYPPEMGGPPPNGVALRYRLRQGRSGVGGTTPDGGYNPDDPPDHVYATIDDAWDAAVASAAQGPYIDAADFFSQSVGDSYAASARGVRQNPTRTVTTHSATATQIDWHWRFHSATCYIKLWWQEAYVDQDGAVVSQEDKEWTWGPQAVEGGMCVRHDFSTQGFGSWNAGESYTVPFDALRPADPPEVGDTDPAYTSHGTALRFYLRNVRWSCTPGYEPPADGTGANGFFLYAVGGQG